MYKITVVTQPTSEPVTVSELKSHLRTNTTCEDESLELYIKAARQVFESRTGLAVLPTVFKQHFYRLCSPIYLQRGNVTAIASVSYYNDDDVLTALDYRSDIVSVPAVVWADSYPVVSFNVRPIGYIQFTAGWINAAAVPAAVKVAIKMLASHWWHNREAFTESKLDDLPLGFRAVVDTYKTGVTYDWSENTLEGWRYGIGHL